MAPKMEIVFVEMFGLLRAKWSRTPSCKFWFYGQLVRQKILKAWDLWVHQDPAIKFFNNFYNRHANGNVREMLLLNIYFYNFYFCIDVCRSMCGHAHISAVALRVQKGPSDPPELELQVVLNYLIWVLGTELNSRGRTENTLNYRAISPVLEFVCF